MMQIHEQIPARAKTLLIVASTFFCGFISTPNLQAYAAEDIVTDIILINGVAELADFTTDGEVVTRHAVVPDYFTSGKSHKRSLREMLNKMKVYGEVGAHDPQIREFYHAPQKCRQALLAVPQDNKNSEISWSNTYEVIDSLIGDYQNEVSNVILSARGAGLPIGDSNHERSEDINQNIRKQRSYIDNRFGQVLRKESWYRRTSKAVIEV